MPVRKQVMPSAYHRLIRLVDKIVPSKLQPVWNHPAGPKTVHFWAPSIKWGLVIAGLGDLNKPADTLSVRQSAVLALTGCIWARYALIIIPKNYNMFGVNSFLAMVQLRQTYRAWRSQCGSAEITH